MKPKDGRTTSKSPAAGEETLKWKGTYTWNVENFSTLDESRVYSPEFEVGGYSWRLLLFPKGNKARGSTNHVSVYLNFPEVEYTPPRMCPKTSFTIKAMKSTNPVFSRKREAAHTFSVDNKSWGFSKFLSFQKVQDPEAGYLVNDTLTFHAKINVQGDNLGTISKRETGILGIKSFGETSLLTSFLQCLHHIKLFRKAVFQMPTETTDDSQKSAPLALQHLFYKLRCQNISAKTKDFIKALDWDCTDMRLQHDVVETQRTLFEKLGENKEVECIRECTGMPLQYDAVERKRRLIKMMREEVKVAFVGSCILNSFTGLYSTCLDSSKCKQSYIGIPLDILECKDIYASLEKFCHSKRLGRDNHDDTARNRKDDSEPYVLFDIFPTVLFCHLKRCYYDSDRNAIVRMNTHFEFYDELDLDYKKRALQSENADRTIENKYRLHSVLVHGNGSGGGSYFAFIRRNERWFKFDNEVVKKVPSMEAINAQFGDQNSTISANFSKGFKTTNKSAAVMLVYIRKSEWKRVMDDAGKKFLPQQVKESFRTEQKEKEKHQKEKQEAHLYVIIKLATESHLTDQIGKSCYFDLVDFDAIKQYRVHKRTPFEDFKEMASNDFEIPKHLQRFWFWRKRTNNTLRTSEPLAEGVHELETVLDLRHFREKTLPPDHEKTALMTINLFLETPKGHSQETDGMLHAIQDNELLIFVKYYDPVAMKLSYLGHLFVEKASSFQSIFEVSKKMAGLGLEEEEEKVIGFKEVQCLPEVICEDLSPENTIEEAQVVQGDIIIIQKLVSVDGLAFPLVSGFLESIQGTQKDDSNAVCISKT